MSYQRMNLKFSRILKQARRDRHELPFDASADSFVLFSDHHKGDGSAADDFKENADLYEAALSYYAERDFRLIILGDSEECWENAIDPILERYGSIIQKEVDLAVSDLRGRKVRVLGNHDKELSPKAPGRKAWRRMWPPLEPVVYREGLCLGPDIFLVHGHQGRFFDDIAWRASRWAVKFIWKSIQKLFLIGSEGPARNPRLKQKLERRYYLWARKKGILLICGHTHRAMFGSVAHFEGAGEEAGRRPEGSAFEPPPLKPVPCYFNTGCCCYTDGLTGLEIDRGRIRLVSWQRPASARAVLAEESLENVLAEIRRVCSEKKLP